MRTLPQPKCEKSQSGKIISASKPPATLHHMSTINVYKKGSNDVGANN